MKKTMIKTGEGLITQILNLKPQKGKLLRLFDGEKLIFHRLLDEPFVVNLNREFTYNSILGGTHLNPNFYTSLVLDTDGDVNITYQ